jgi:hypothetical protein
VFHGGDYEEMPSSGVLRHVALVRTDVSEENISSIIRVTRFGELYYSIFSQRNSVASYCRHP